MAPERNQRKKKVVISYTASAASAYRPQSGPPAEPQEIARMGRSEHHSTNAYPATSGNELDPIYPAPYSNFRHALASGSMMTNFLLGQIRRAAGPFGLHVDNLRPDESFTSIVIDALDLVSLILKGGTGKIDGKTRTQVDVFLKDLIASRLVRVHLSLLGTAEREHDATIYQVLWRARSTLTHLCLELNFRDKKALQEYLCSEAAARLVSLELKSGSNLQTHVLKALQSEGSSRLPNLRYLCLNKPVTPAKLMKALRTRDDLNRKAHNPAYPPLTIEVVDVHKFSDSALAQAQNMQITFVEYDVVRPTGN
ncbi:uncharacterized protein SCHCODRAFT_01096478 [Schizophyllum commune H4-8]|nr:uncharacterized protein SCHCODRAFT_01096478 [Schizophyllum commune H4-8]KAI5891093.1 hypothetical protein SCHCODRAFT_01096478 [Schizophyllum commune H4-8]